MVKVLKPKGTARKVQARKEEGRTGPVDPRQESLRMLSKFYLGEMDLDMKTRQITVASGEEPPVWMAALELMKDRVIKTEDPDLKLKMYQAMVDMLAVLGHVEDMKTIQAIIARVNLVAFKDMGFEKVEVECDEDACPACRKLNGKKFLIKDAMEQMPLPCQDCGTEKDAVKGYCRCRYFATF